MSHKSFHLILAITSSFLALLGLIVWFSSVQADSPWPTAGARVAERQASGDVSAAGLTDWKNLGLYGGPVQNAVYDSTRSDAAYLASPGSFYKSTDGGATWSEMVDVGGQDVAVHPTHGRVYVIRGGSQPGLGFSDDGGATWTEYNEPSGQVWDMALDPNDQLAVFIATGGELSDPPTSGRIHRTLDGGQTWSVWDTSSHESDQCMTSVSVNPQNSNEVWAVGGKCGAGNPSFTSIYSSTDRGATFTSVLDSGSPNVVFNHLALTDEGGGNVHIYVSTYNSNPSDPNDNGVWISLDGGQTFSQTLHGHWPSQMVVNPHTGHVHVDDYHSDGSGGWVNDQWPPLFDIDPLTPNSQRMLAPIMGGIQRSTIGGFPGNWSRVNTGIEELQVWAVTTDPSDPRTVYAGTGSGFGRTFDDGETWDFPIPMGPSSEIQAISDIAVNPMTPTVIYALQWAGGEIWRSADGGSTWVEKVLTTTAGAGGQVAIDPNDTGIVYAAWVSEGNPGDGHLYQTTDGGQNWGSAELGGVPVNAVEAVDDTAGTTVYAGVGDLFTGYPAGGVYRRRAGESNWTQVGPTNTVVHDIAVDPRDARHLYIGVGPGVPNQPPYGMFESHDGGDNWTQLNVDTNDAGIWTIAIDPDDPDTIYAGTQNQIYRSRDGGARWTLYYSDPTFESTFNTLHIPWLPPGPVNNLTATPVSTDQIRLDWDNPTEDSFVGTTLRYSTTTFPIRYDEGFFLTDQPASPGSSDSFTHTGVTSGITYYYAAFAYDDRPSYASPAQASATAGSVVTGTFSGVQPQQTEQRASTLYLAAGTGLYSRSIGGGESVYLPIILKNY